MSEPSQQTQSGIVFDTRRGALRAWIEQLPGVDPEASGDRLMEALRQVNAQRSARAELLRFLEAAGPAAATALAQLETRYAHHPLPLDAAGRRAATLALELTASLMRGYAKVLRAQEGGMQWPWQRLRIRRQRGTALHRLFGYGRHFIGIHRLLHLDTPAGVWRRLHRLRRLAEAEGLARCRVRRLEDDGGTTTVCHEYRRLLLGAMVPASVTADQEAEIRASLDSWTALVTLGTTAGAADYAVCLESDGGAQPVAHASGQGARRYLDTRRLRARLQGRGGSGSRWRPAERVVSAAVRELLHECWCTARAREEPRLAMAVPAEVGIGLGVLFRLAGGRPATEGRAQFVPAGHPGYGVERLVGPETERGATAGAVAGRIVNRSDNGVSVVIPYGSVERLAVGMAMAIRTRGEGWWVGTVERLRHRRGGVELGARLHLQGVVPARLHTTEAGRASPRFEVLAGLAGDNRWAVVAPAVSSLRGGDPVLEVNNRSRVVRRGARLHHSRYAEIFAIHAPGDEALDFVAAAPAVSGRPAPAGAANRRELRVLPRDDRETRISDLMKTAGLSRRDAEYVAEMEAAVG